MNSDVIIVVAVVVGIFIAILTAGTLLNIVVARWISSRWIREPAANCSWAQFHWNSFMAMWVGIFASKALFFLLIAGRSHLGVHDAPGPPAPSLGGPPEWYILTCLLGCVVFGTVLELAVFTWRYARRLRG
ncbi:MAG: hypothetical protein KDA75_07915 [Planctomycetaceae bacterium]|nr:hypothetical protein [Planctomycetaceae bacterium]